jgi:hypothetical protein
MIRQKWSKGYLQTITSKEGGKQEREDKEKCGDATSHRAKCPYRGIGDNFICHPAEMYELNSWEQCHLSSLLYKLVLIFLSTQIRCTQSGVYTAQVVTIDWRTEGSGLDALLTPISTSAQPRQL